MRPRHGAALAAIGRHSKSDAALKACEHMIAGYQRELKTTRRMADAVRRGDGPAFVEFRTYRFRAHSMFDPELYRDKSERESWKKRDRIPMFRAQLEQHGDLDAAAVAVLDTEVATENRGRGGIRGNGDWEPVEDLTKDVYTP